MTNRQRACGLVDIAIVLTIVLAGCESKTESKDMTEQSKSKVLEEQLPPEQKAFYKGLKYWKEKFKQMENNQNPDEIEHNQEAFDRFMNQYEHFKIHGWCLTISGITLNPQRWHLFSMEGNNNEAYFVNYGLDPRAKINGKFSGEALSQFKEGDVVGVTGEITLRNVGSPDQPGFDIDIVSIRAW